MSIVLPPFFYELFTPSNPRLGPGDDVSTKRALDLALAALRKNGYTKNFSELKILDIGCGNGPQTIVLASQTGGTITAVDNYEPFLDELMRRAADVNVSNCITPLQHDMAALGSRGETYDLVWAEGSLFVMGFEPGLAMCHELLPQKGVLAVSELTWLRDDPPEECRAFFDWQYPAIQSIDDNLSLIERYGYDVLGCFVQPEASWWDQYYNPLEANIEPIRGNCSDESEEMTIIKSVQREIEMFRNYSDWFGYVFYILERS